VASKITNLKKAKPKVNQEVVAMMNSIMEKVLSGEVDGIVLFMSATGNEVWDGSAGNISFSEAILAMENWKFKQLFAQNVVEK
jgi:hypothetical protein